MYQEALWQVNNQRAHNMIVKSIGLVRVLHLTHSDSSCLRIMYHVSTDAVSPGVTDDSPYLGAEGKSRNTMFCLTSTGR